MKIELEHVDCIICGKPQDGNSTIATSYDFEYKSSEAPFHFSECKNCKHVFLNPRPTIGSSHLIYPNSYYTLSAPTAEKRNSEKLVAWLKQKIVLKRLAPLLKTLPAKARILEIGCGDGSTLVTIKKAYPSFEVVGNDLNFNEEQRQYLESNGVMVLESVFEEAQVPDNYYDLIFMNQLIEHLWDVELCIKKTRDTLKTDGILSISTPNLDGYDRRFCKKKLWGGYHTPRHLNLFSRSSLSGYLKRFGLTEIGFSNLTAPLIHVTTLGNYFTDKKSKLANYCNYRNVPLLMMFTFSDIVFSALGASTSNQQLIVKKAGLKKVDL